MSKNESQIMKGFAILFMIFLHLFNREANVDLCQNLIYINGEPLVYILSRAANPVGFFLILAGYGLYRVYENVDRNRWVRILKLLLHHSVILTVFLIIGHFIKPEVYPGSIFKIIINYTGWEATYNGEMWFLLPYIILSILSIYIFKFIKSIRPLYVIIITLLIHMSTSYCISRFGQRFLYHNYWAYNPVLVFHLLFNFCMGALAASRNFFERLKKIYGQ